MSTFSALVLERGAATAHDLEHSIVSQVLHGGDLGTNLVEIGALKENALQRLLSAHYEMAIGPHGQLPELEPELKELVPPELALRIRAYPVRRTRRTLHVAVGEPLEPEAEKDLRDTAGLQLRQVVVTPLRLGEALARECGHSLGDRQRNLLEQLNAGVTPQRRVWVREVSHEVTPASAPYRRMSERPSGIVMSDRQSRQGDGVPPTEVPDTLDGVGPEDKRREMETVEPPDRDSIATSPPPDKLVDAFTDPERITQPYAEDDEDNKRDTQPWRDDDSDDAPLSVAGEFRASLSEAPPSEEARVDEEHRRFRHRGPFTRPQAELAVSQAPDVHMVLEILLRYARQFFERSVVLVVAGRSAELRLAHGLSIELATLTVRLDEPSVMSEAVEAGDPIVRPLAHAGIDDMLRDELDVNGEQPVAVIPVCIRERVVALFYGDDRNDGVDRNAVDDVTDFTEICAGEITRLILARKRG